jgi:tight adherence protein C
MAAAAGSLPLVFMPFDAAVLVGAIVGMLVFRWVPRIPDGKAQAAAQERIQTMPIVLDVLSLGLDAGISWDRATAYASECASGELATELQRAAHRLALGAAPHEVWTGGLGQISVVVERSFRSGAPVSTLLRQQADALRADERVRRLGQSRKLAEKVLVPVTLLGMPAFFLLALLPTLASIASTLTLHF